MLSPSPIPFTVGYAQLFDTVETRLAIKLDDLRRADVLRIADNFVNSGKARHVQELTQYLANTPTTQPIWQTIIQAVTIGETYFFRDRNQWEALRHNILPRLIQGRRAQGRFQLRVWSAGCSTGEEPYSLAILIRELIPDFAAWDIHILGTDLNINHLERAQKGQYRPWSFRLETPETLRQTWFTEKNDVYQIDPSIRSMVTFSPHNLANFAHSTFDPSIIEMDLIFCRNVLIYFDNAISAGIVRRFYDALREGGWLVLGASEGMVTTNHKLKARQFANATMFEKLPEAYPEEEAPKIGGMPFSLPVPRVPKGVTTPFPTPPNQTTASHNGTSANHNGVEVEARPNPMRQALRAANREAWDEALGWLADAEKADPLHPEVYYLRGVIELHQTELDKALASLRRAIYCDTNFVLAHYALGELYQTQGDYKKAASEWKLAQTIVRNMEPESRLSFSEDLTAAMLLELLQYRLDSLPEKR